MVVRVFGKKSVKKSGLCCARRTQFFIVSLLCGKSNTILLFLLDSG